MNFVLFAVGLIVTAAGFVTIGFGIPINAFSLGNTLIISGAVAVGSGLILIGLALILGQLKRIAEALKGRASVARASEPADAIVAPASRTALAEPHVSEPPPATPLFQPEPHTPEPRFPATASEAAPGPLDWLRAKSKPGTAAPAASASPAAVETPMVDLTDEAPLSPRSPQRTEPAADPKVWSPSRDAGSFEFRPSSRSDLPTPRTAPQVEPAKEKERFDLAWPDRGAAPASGESKVEPNIGEPRVDMKREPAVDMPLPPVPARPRETRLAAERRMPEAARKPAVERGPAILKSGVIDGMPYTLYADGSIEAQLAQGMVKFASVDALRAHLEKQG